MYIRNRMRVRRFGQMQQMWLLILACLIIFGAILWLIPEMTGSFWWKIVVAAIVASGASIGLFQLWLRGVLARREGIIKLLHRVTSGDLTLSAREIVDETQSTRMAAAMRALVANLERTIRRFGQLASDVAKASDQISGRSRILARSASDQLHSTESTSSSVTQID